MSVKQGILQHFFQLRLVSGLGTYTLGSLQNEGGLGGGRMVGSGLGQFERDVGPQLQATNTKGISFGMFYGM
jgi:hypothetical protein